MNKKQIKGILYKVDGTSMPVTLPYYNSLEYLQNLVGGNIEVIYLVEYQRQIRGDMTKGNDLVINEEGSLLELEVNPWSSKIVKDTIWQGEDFRGDIFLVKGKLR